MNMRDGLIKNQALRVLDNDRYALILVVVLMLLPYAAWASMTILSLVTLRKGWKQGGLLLIPALTAHILVSLMSTVLAVALIDACARVLPCYVATCVLRSTSSWKAIAFVFFVFIVLGAFSLHLFAPELIDAQYVYLQAVLKETDSGRIALGLWEEQKIRSFVFSNYLLGFQAVCFFGTILSPVMFARSLQSQLYYPGGFQQEMLNFRGDKQSVIVLVLLCLAAYQEHLLAMNSLPLILFYFILAGLSFSAHVLIKMKPLRVFVLLMVPFILFPLLVMPLYVLLGALDSLFNFRLYLSPSAGKTT